MFTQEETEQWCKDLYINIWGKDTSLLSKYFAEDCVASGFSPPKMATYTGLEEITKRCQQMWPHIGLKNIDIHRCDITAKSPQKSYIEQTITYKMKPPGAEEEVFFPVRMLVYMARDKESGKAKEVRMWEDPEPFVAMALKGELPSF